MFLCLILAHMLSDFVFQTDKMCKHKFDNKQRSSYQYWHAFVVFVLSWLLSFEFGFWWCAIIISVSHCAIDIWKSYFDEDVKWFIIDQMLHIVIIVGMTLLWRYYHNWVLPSGINVGFITLTTAIIICWKPANIFIRLVLQHCSVNVPKDDDGGFRAGALIGTIERWLVLFFVIIQRYDALGFLIAAKSIIRFGEKDRAKTEYVLAGTLLSVFIAVLAGLLVQIVRF